MTSRNLNPAAFLTDSNNDQTERADGHMADSDGSVRSRVASKPKGRRKAPGKRWSASSTVEWILPNGSSVRSRDVTGAPTDAVKAKVHYRLDGGTKKPTVTGGTRAELLANVDVRQNELRSAYLHDWPADDDGRPVAPKSLDAIGHEPAPDADAPVHVPTVGKSLLALGAAGSVDAVIDAVALVAWFKSMHRTARKKKGGETKADNTQNNYASCLGFFAEHARYAVDDPRLDILGLEPGASWRFDRPDAPITAADLIHLLEVRAQTNLTVRGQNERKLAKWRTQLQSVQDAMVRDGRPRAMPAMPALRAERAKARTVESFAQQAKSMLVQAFMREQIAYQPWSASVDDAVITSESDGIHQGLVASLGQVRELAATATVFERASRDEKSRHVTLTGERYAAMIWLAGFEGPRPEETIALRASWVILDPEDPRLELRGAEVVQPAINGKTRRRSQVPLKHRSANVVRIVRPLEENRAEFIAVLSAHREKFVPAPDPSSDDPDVRDPYFFTTHRGFPVDLSNFNDTWWKPIRGKVFIESGPLMDMQFRRLRAAAITSWLIAGMSIYEAAEKAGNSQAVIEKHYRGVLDSLPRRGVRPSDTLAPAGAPAELSALDQLADGEFLTLVQKVTAEQMRRLSTGNAS